MLLMMFEFDEVSDAVFFDLFGVSGSTYLCRMFEIMKFYFGQVWPVLLIQIQNTIFYESKR